jgi:hypothetical protein
VKNSFSVAFPTPRHIHCTKPVPACYDSCFIHIRSLGSNLGPKTAVLSEGFHGLVGICRRSKIW